MNGRTFPLKLIQFLLGLIIWASTNAIVYANHGIFDTTFEQAGQIFSFTEFDEIPKYPEIPNNSEVSFQFVIARERGNPSAPAPSCTGQAIELHGWMIRKLSGIAVTDLLPPPVHCADFENQSQSKRVWNWKWDQKDRNGRFVPTGIYEAEIITAGVPEHDGIYSTIFVVVRKSDLDIQQLGATNIAGGLAQVSALVRNIGSVSARKVTVDFHSDKDCSGPSSPIDLGSVTINVVPAKSTQTAILTVPQDELSECLIAEVDPKNVIPESNENNNRFPPRSSGGGGQVATPDPLLTFVNPVPNGFGGLSALSLQISWEHLSFDDRRGLSNFNIQIILPKPGAKILGVQWGPYLKGSFRISGNKQVVSLSFKPKRRNVPAGVPPGLASATLAQLSIQSAQSFPGAEIRVVGPLIDAVQFSDPTESNAPYTKYNLRNNIPDTSSSSIMGQSIDSQAKIRSANHDKVSGILPASLQRHDFLELIVSDTAGRVLFAFRPIWGSREPETTKYIEKLTNGVFFCLVKYYDPTYGYVKRMYKFLVIR